MLRARTYLRQKSLKILAAVIVLGGVYFNLGSEGSAAQEFQQEAEQSINKKYRQDQLLRIADEV